MRTLNALVGTLLVATALAGCAMVTASTPDPQPTPPKTVPAAPTAAPSPTVAPEAASGTAGSLQLVRSVELPFVPHDIALDPAGSLYAVEFGAPMVHRLDGDGNVLHSWGGEGSAPGQFLLNPPPDGPPLVGGFLVIGADGNVYVSDSYNDRVQIFDPEGTFVTMWEQYGPDDTPFNNPGPISADADGNIYVADFSGVHQFDAEGNHIRSLQAAGEVAFDSAGTLYTTLAFENFVLRIPAEGGEPQRWGSEGTDPGRFLQPMWLGIDDADTVYVSDHSGRVQRFDGDGRVIEVWSDPGNGDDPLNGPSPIAMGPDSELHVATKDRRKIYVLAP